MMVSVEVPLVCVVCVATVSVETSVLVGSTRLGENATVDPNGWPASVNVTGPLKPLARVIVTLNVAVAPRWIVTDVGATESVKSETVTVAVPLTVPLVAVTVEVPAVDPAVNTPVDGPRVPPPITDHVNVGCGNDDTIDTVRSAFVPHVSSPAMP